MRSIIRYIDAPLLLGLVLAVVAAGCSDDPSGNNGGDADTDADTDIDTDADTDTDSYLYGDPCAGEVEVDGIYWCRCDVGQSWNGEICEGNSKDFDWDSAWEICPEGYSMAHHIDFAALLGNCDVDFDDDYDMVTCDSCSQSASCISVFEDDPFGHYWTANGYESNSAWAVQLSSGEFFAYEMDYEDSVRCCRYE